mgnify:CR=1 FL=1
MNYRFLLALLLACHQLTINSQTSNLKSQITFVELNCENLFDWRHDEGKADLEFTPDGNRHWTPKRYWRKVNDIGRVILSCADELPDVVVLLEVENDSAVNSLVRHSLLRNARYDYLMTESPDVRGLDVALLYRQEAFRPLCYDAIEVAPLKGMRPTRDVLYVEGVTAGGDTLHLFLVHAPSRWGGESVTIPYRKHVADYVCNAIGRLPADAYVVAVGDFNDYADSPAMRRYATQGLHNVTQHATGRNGARGTYWYQGEWNSLDHVLVSSSLVPRVDSVYVNDARFLLHIDGKDGQLKPFRTFDNNRYQRGYSDHLPIVVRLRF